MCSVVSLQVGVTVLVLTPDRCRVAGVGVQALLSLQSGDRVVLTH